jgi:hypothetical protein
MKKVLFDHYLNNNYLLIQQFLIETLFNKIDSLQIYNIKTIKVIAKYINSDYGQNVIKLIHLYF